MTRDVPIGADCVVELAYELVDERGASVETSDEDGTIRYRHGHEEILPGLESALEGRRTGDELEVTLAGDEAFGTYDPAGLFSVPRDELPGDDYAPGDFLTIGVEDGDETDELEARVVEVQEDSVLFDANHPLAGQRVTFKLRVLSVESSQAD